MQTENSSTLPYTPANLVGFLRERKLETMVAWLLDILGPVSLVLAQFIHAGSTLLRPSLTASQVNTLTRILEDPFELQAFKVLLREDIFSGK